METAFARNSNGPAVDVEVNISDVTTHRLAVIGLSNVRRRILFKSKDVASLEPISLYRRDETQDGDRGDFVTYMTVPSMVPDTPPHPAIQLVLQSSRGRQRPLWTEKDRTSLLVALRDALPVSATLGYGAAFRQQAKQPVHAAMRVGSNGRPADTVYTTTVLVERDPQKIPSAAVADLVQTTGPYVIVPGHGLVEPGGARHSTVFYPAETRNDAIVASVESDALTQYDPEHRATNVLDCSLAKVTGNFSEHLPVAGIPPITGYLTIAPDHRGKMVYVCKSDGTQIKCNIVGVGLQADAMGPGGVTHTYDGMFTVARVDDDSPVTNMGDSGCPVLYYEQGKTLICGMVIAGPDKDVRGRAEREPSAAANFVRPQTLCLPIDRVMAFYGVKPMGKRP